MGIEPMNNGFAGRLKLVGQHQSDRSRLSWSTARPPRVSTRLSHSQPVTLRLRSD